MRTVVVLVTCGLLAAAISTAQAVENGHLGSSCTRNEDCAATANSICAMGACECAQGTIFINFPPRCLQIPKDKNDPCEDDLQCTQAFTLGSFCGESMRCDCYPEYHFVDGVCLRGEPKTSGSRSESFVTDSPYINP